MKVAFACLTLLLCASGCNQITMVDDVDLTLDFTPLLGPSDSLHQPYVQGSSMTLWVRSSDSHTDETGWSLASEDPTIFTVGPSTLDDRHRNQFSATGHALTAGTARLDVLDAHGRRLRTETVDVALPDRVELMAHGLLLIGKSDAEADVADARIRSGGTATYLARYWRGPERLYGNGALSTDQPNGVTAQVAQTFLFENRDWLQLSPTQTGNSLVALSVGGVHVADLPVEAVPDSDVASLRIMGEDESRAHKGEWLVALAQATGAQGLAIYGVDYSWDVDGTPQLGLGDLYRYQYDPRNPNMLRASFGGMNAEAMIHGYGFVDSSNNLGCSFVPGRPAGRSPLAAMVLFGLFALGALSLSRYRGTSGSSCSPDRR